MSTQLIEKETTQETPAQKPHYNVIGTRPIRHDGVDKVTGRALYGADVRLNGMLYGKVLRSPHAHARILSIDVSQALALPGVKAVVTSADFPRLQDKVENLGEGAVNLRYLSDNCMASDKVLYHGHAVAAVAASSSHIAEEALALIRVEYEILPPVLDVLQALQEDAPILLDSLRTSEFGRKGTRPTNLAGHEQYQRGNLEKGFAQADVCVEREFHTATVHQGYVEPQNATAQYNADGQVTVWTSTQGAHGARDQIADILQLPASRVKVIPMEIGGGFGGKLGVYLEPIAVLLSRKSGGRPVQLVMTRFEVLAATGPHVQLGDARQNRRRQNRSHHRRTGQHVLRGRRLPGFAGRFGHGRHFCPLSPAERADRWLRCGDQPAARGGLSRAGRHQCRLCRGSGDRRTGREVGAWTPCSSAC